MFNKKILPDKVKIKQKDSSTGDKCHYEIEGLGDKVAKKIFTENFNLIADGKICNNQIPKKLTMETILLYLHQAG
ncbi:MAG: hypothetical protein Q8P24_04615 [Desulfobacterales bacterium]|nr:hypothetical protein [Desulfobacterales bacterium]